MRIKQITAFLAAVMMLSACSAIEENVPDENVIANATVQVITETSALTDENLADADTTKNDDPIVTEQTEDTYETEEDVTVSYEDGDVESIELTFYSVTLSVNESRMPIVTMYPEAAEDKSEIWTSSDESVATVDELGKITAVSEGKCIITVTSAASPSVSASVDVKVKKPVSQPTYINGILVVNKTYALPADYSPGVDSDAQAAFDKMRADAAKEGLNIYISSGFRTYDYQKGLYERYVKRSGQAEADRYSARPGHSEHQTGLAFDLNTIDSSFADTDEYAWVKENCADYGFIIRYPENGEKITGYMYEPWHIRYLGTENAKKVYESGLTLEEYLGIDSVYDE